MSGHRPRGSHVRRTWVRTMVAVLLAGAWCAPTAAHAQAVEAVLGGAQVSRLVEYRSVTYRQRGRTYGGEGAVLLGRLRLGASGASGLVRADDGAPNADVRIRSSALTAQVAVSRTLLLGMRWEGRRFSSDVGVTAWTLAGPTVRLEPDFGLAGLRGVADVAVLSNSAVRHGPALDKAIQTTMGLSYTPPGSPVEARLTYRFERFDVGGSVTTSARFEETRAVVLEVAVRARR